MECENSIKVDVCGVVSVGSHCGESGEEKALGYMVSGSIILPQRIFMKLRNLLIVLIADFTQNLIPSRD